MAKDKAAELERLGRYAALLKRRISESTPPKHVGHEKEFLQMLKIDLFKTELRIKQLEVAP